MQNISEFPNRVDDLIYFQDVDVDHVQVRQTYQDMFKESNSEAQSYSAPNEYMQTQEGVFGYFANLFNLLWTRVYTLQKHLKDFVKEFLTAYGDSEEVESYPYLDEIPTWIDIKIGKETEDQDYKGERRPDINNQTYAHKDSGGIHTIPYILTLIERLFGVDAYKYVINKDIDKLYTQNFLSDIEDKESNIEEFKDAYNDVAVKYEEEKIKLKALVKQNDYDAILNHKIYQIGNVNTKLFTSNLRQPIAPRRINLQLSDFDNSEPVMTFDFNDTAKGDISLTVQMPQVYYTWCVQSAVVIPYDYKKATPTMLTDEEIHDYLQGLFEQVRQELASKYGEYFTDYTNDDDFVSQIRNDVYENVVTPYLRGGKGEYINSHYNYTDINPSYAYQLPIDMYERYSGCETVGAIMAELDARQKGIILHLEFPLQEPVQLGGVVDYLSYNWRNYYFDTGIRNRIGEKDEQQFFNYSDGDSFNEDYPIVHRYDMLENAISYMGNGVLYNYKTQMDLDNAHIATLKSSLNTEYFIQKYEEIYRLADNLITPVEPSVVNHHLVNLHKELNINI